MAGTPTKERRKEEFLDHVAGETFGGPGVDAEPAVRAVFAVMRDRIDAGEADKVTAMLPEELRALWPEVQNGGTRRGRGVPGML